MVKFLNSKIMALLVGAWVGWCMTIGDYDGAVFLLFFYLLMVWDFSTKKTTNTHDAGGK